MGGLILLAEDDERQAEAVRRFLVHDGHEVRVVHDGVTALDACRRHGPDLVVLDVMMPGLNGVEVCKILRRESGVPVLMLTARVEEDDLVAGLESGADDYLTKPYSPRELTVRVRALLRRVPRADELGKRLSVGDLVIDTDRRTVQVAGEDLPCTTAEFEILAALAGHPGRALTRAQLVERTNGIDRESTPRAIDTHVANLRRKLEADPRSPRRLLTVYGYGYKLSET